MALLSASSSARRASLSRAALVAQRVFASLSTSALARARARAAQRGFDAVVGELERCKVGNAARVQQLQAERDEATQRAAAADAQLKALRREFEALEVGSADAESADAEHGDAEREKAARERAARLSAIESLPAGETRRTQLLLELDARCHETAAALQRERSARRLKQLELDQVHGARARAHAHAHERD